MPRRWAAWHWRWSSSIRSHRAPPAGAAVTSATNLSDLSICLRRRLAIVLRHTGIPSSEHPAGSAPLQAGKTEVNAPKWIFFHLVPLRTCAWHGRQAEKEKWGCTREFCDSLIFQPLDYPPIRAPGTWDVEICTERCSSDCIIRNTDALAGRWTG